MSSTRRIYMDNAASRKVDPRVVEVMLPFMKLQYGNPFSLHDFGNEAREELEKSRAKIAELINAERKECVIFTSGATESNNLAIKGAANRAAASNRNQIITSSIEHMSVMNPCKYMGTKGFEVNYLPVDRYGFINIDHLQQKLTEKTATASITLASSEIGTIEPIKEIGEIVHGKEAYLHVDATAANGQIPIDVKGDGIDLLTLSSNDMYGPRGVGALYIKDGVRVEPLFHGGGQERGLRSGTENIPGIVGFGRAAEIARIEMGSESSRLMRLRDQLIKGLLEGMPYTFLNGHPTKRLPNNVAVRYSFIEGESMLLSLDMLGIAASSGSACTAKTLEPSHVLLAIGLKHEEAHGSLLFTLGNGNSAEDIDYVISVMPDIVKRLRRMSPLTPKGLED